MALWPQLINIQCTNSDCISLFLIQLLQFLTDLSHIGLICLGLCLGSHQDLACPTSISDCRCDTVYTVLQKYVHIGLKQNLFRSTTLDIITRLLDNAAFVCVHVVGRFSKDFSEVHKLRVSALGGMDGNGTVRGIMKRSVIVLGTITTFW